MFKLGQEIYLYDQMVYRFEIQGNKLHQESKKISDALCLVPSMDHSYLLVRLSIDIFRHGIHVYFGDKHETVFPSGNPEMATEIEHIKIDLKQVDFCLEIYKGVYIMLAHHNLWVLDINFMCFFSFAPIQRLKNYFKNKTYQLEEPEFIFEIIDQPFHANWLTHHDNLNAAAEGDQLHILANVQGKLFYLNYQFILEAGMLRLKHYQPLFTEADPREAIRGDSS